jgi:hypothetical protein
VFIPGTANEGPLVFNPSWIRSLQTANEIPVGMPERGTIGHNVARIDEDQKTGCSHFGRSNFGTSSQKSNRNADAARVQGIPQRKPK